MLRRVPMRDASLDRDGLVVPEGARADGRGLLSDRSHCISVAELQYC